MKKITKKTGTIQDISLTFEQKQMCFDILKKHIAPNQKIAVAVS